MHDQILTSGALAFFLSIRLLQAEAPVAVWPDYFPPGQTNHMAEKATALIEKVQKNPPAPGGILLYGSSIMANWESVAADMAPLPVSNHAIGGSRTWEMLFYADALVLPYQPKVIVYYCGSNDIGSSQNAAGVTDRFRLFDEKVTAAKPGTKIIYLAVLRAPKRRDRWNVIDAANTKTRAYCRGKEHLEFVDLNPCVADGAGEPRADFYLEDQLHYQPAAYQAFTRVLRPILEKNFP